MSESALTARRISAVVHRRFVLGKQGLWPGRRWQADPNQPSQAATAAINTMQALQLDPLTVVARSHDIAMYGRVRDYQPQQLDQAAYAGRQFFDYGGCLHLYPMAELPYWRLHMARKLPKPYWQERATEHAETINFVRQELRANGPLGNRDFTGSKRVNSYRGRKDSAVALYYLWITGQVMIHHRVGFQRIYDLAENVAPPQYQTAAPEAEAEAFFARKALAFEGLSRLGPWINRLSDYIQRPISRSDGRAWMNALLAEGTAIAVDIDGTKEPFYALGEDAPLLDALVADQIPAVWQPLAETTQDEVVFLAPLEICTARRRALKLFDFDYLWEVYKPLEKRRWGYYTLPILWGDRLVARADMRLERKRKTLVVAGFWLESDQSGDDPAFKAALQRGLQRFANFVQAEAIEGL